MRFILCYANHGAGVGVEDILVYVRNAVRTAGHEAYIAPYPQTSGFNILIESFPDQLSQGLVELRRTTDARFIVIATEFTDGKTFNSHTAQADAHYGNAGYWQARFDGFKRVAAVSTAVWCMCEYQVERYRDLLPGVPVLLLPRGFDPLMQPPVHAALGGKDIDLLFTGNVTSYRRGVLNRLAASFNVVIATPATQYCARVDLIARAKANLHINLVENALYNSVGRHHFILMNKGPLLSERAVLPGELDEFATELDSDALVEQIRDYLAGGRWQRDGEEMYERYRLSRPLKEPMETLLAESLGTREAMAGCRRLTEGATALAGNG
jgi:hypothetical protein